jgi:multisubunit Na+/H+ antiporter MnhB subunit
VERASRLIVLVSIALAVAVHAWLVHDQPGLATAAGVAFATSFTLARVALPVALAVAGATAFVAPALLWIAFGTSNYQQTIVWFAILAAVIVARADYGRWSVPRHWMPWLATWAVIVAVSWPIVAAREIDFSVAVASMGGATTPLLAAPPRVAAAFVAIFALGQLLAIAWLDFLWAHFAERLDAFRRLVIAPIVSSAVLGSLVGIYQRFIDPTWVNPRIWANENRAGGLMLDANAFGTGAALLAPVAFVLASSIGRPSLGRIAFAILATGMWSSGSRTALLVFSIGTGAMLIGVLRDRGWWQPRFGRVMAALGVGLFLVAAATLPRDFDSRNPVARAFARVPPLEASEIRRFASELWVRFGYGTAADEIVLDYPIAGVGIGAFHIVAPEYIYRDSGRIVAGDNAQNWWRQQLAELGVVGALPALWFSVIVALLCRTQQKPDVVGTTLRGALIGLGVASMLGVPTQSAGVAMAFTTLLFLLATRTLGSRAEPPSRPSQIALIIVTVAAIAGLTYTAIGELRPVHRAMRASVPYEYGLAPAQESSAFGDVRWMATRAVSFTPTHERWLRVTTWNRSNEPVRFELRVNGEWLVSEEITSAGPVSFALDLVAAPRAVIEMRAAPEVLPGRALQLALTWHPERPRGVPDSHVVVARAASASDASLD